MIDLASIEKLNEELFRKINQEALANPRSPYAGKYVGIANGRVVAVDNSLRAVTKALNDSEPDREKTLTFEASADYDRVQYILIVR
ncbi:MAG: hypothetical protein L0211_16540 [Planctomycetaceae bacterium]|nr:hypothetical protein [Planctomycetaceae bacterium]